MGLTKNMLPYASNPKKLRIKVKLNSEEITKNIKEDI